MGSAEMGDPGVPYDCLRYHSSYHIAIFMTRLGNLNVKYLCPLQIKGTREKTEEEPKNVFWATLTCQQGRANMPAVTARGLHSTFKR